MAEPQNSPGSAAAVPGRDVANPQAPEPRTQPEVDHSQAKCGYANFCRITGTPEELVIDFGLNPQPMGAPSEPIPVTQRIITNLYTAKRLLHVLQLTIQRHEATFGAVEVDVQRRAGRRNA
jgi:hypothetical protein